MEKYVRALALCLLLLSVCLTAACGLRPTPPADGATAPADTPPPTQGPPYTVTLVCSLPEGYTLSGGDGVQVVENQADYIPVTVSVEPDFRYEGYEIDGVIYTESTVRLPAEPTADVTVRLLVSHLTEELPVISIHTDGVPVDSKEYVDMTMSLTGTDAPLWNVGGQVRLRGNSTAGLDKKPYRIKLDQKHGLLGLDKAKSWVLLADYLDPSALHNYAALTLAGTSEQFDFVPTPHKVNLYMNGEYAGLYTLCEQVQENPGRMDLECEITPYMTDARDYNFLVCMNYNAPEKPGAEEGVTYFYLSGCDRYFELEYPTREDFSSERRFRRFFDSLESFIRDTVTAYQTRDLAYIEENTDVDSLVDMLIIDEIMGERDHHWKSFYLYYRGADGDDTDVDKLRFGPPWDYDFCMFTEWTGEPNEEYVIKNTLNEGELNLFYRPLLAEETLYRRVKLRYEEHFAPALNDVIRSVEAQANAMPESLALNQDKWYPDKPTVTEDNVSFFLRYLKARRTYLNRVWRP